MHRHDQDIIMALADGSLAGAAGDEARSEIEACDDCRSELISQQAALDWLATAEPIEMSELETSRLRRNLDTELGHDRAGAAAAVAAAEQRSGRWSYAQWGALASVAAVLLAVVLVAPSLTLLGAGSDDETVALNTTAVEQESADAQATPETESRSSGAAERDDTALTEAAEEAEMADEPAMATAPTTAAPAAGDAAESFGGGQLEDILAEFQNAEGDSNLAMDRLATALTMTIITVDPSFNCLADSAAEVEGSLQREVVGIVPLLAGEALVIVHYGGIGDVLAVTGHKPDTCDLLDIAPPR